MRFKKLQEEYKLIFKQIEETDVLDLHWPSLLSRPKCVSRKNKSTSNKTLLTQNLLDSKTTDRQDSIENVSVHEQHMEQELITNDFHEAENDNKSEDQLTNKDIKWEDKSSEHKDVDLEDHSDDKFCLVEKDELTDNVELEDKSTNLQNHIPVGDSGTHEMNSQSINEDDIRPSKIKFRSILLHD